MTLAVSFESLGTTVRLIQVNLAFDGLTLTNHAGSAGTALPTWFFIPFPDTGSLKFLAVDFSGIGQPIDGPIFSATFTVDAAAADGEVPVIVVFADVRDGDNNSLKLTLTPGVVTVNGP